MLFAIASLGFASAPQDAVSLPVITLSDDDVRIEESCIVEVGDTPIVDANGNGVLHVIGNDVVVDFRGAQLVGSPAGTAPNKSVGTAIRVTGQRATIRNAHLVGFRCGIYATNADGLTIVDCEFRNGFRQRLASTPTAESNSDWLEPHDNDANEWLTKYGAAIYVEDSSEVRIHDVKVRTTQNGILLDRVERSWIYDNDCSFLSGWGIGLWRSSENNILRNAVDFCVRGYSHGIYNRGQDSAGILMFEQSSNNVVAKNSATHCGDGIFLFAGREALGERPPITDKGANDGEIKGELDAEYYVGRGSNENSFYENDLSHCVAHGLEATFSFNNRVQGNRFHSNAICGIWGGYSNRMKVQDNDFSENGFMGYGLERGAVNIEHGRASLIGSNRFRNNACGVHLWMDDDGALEQTPWALANGTECTNNRIHGNEFEGDSLAIQIRDSLGNMATKNIFKQVGKDLDYTPDAAQPGLRVVGKGLPPREPTYEDIGEREPVGQRTEQGRTFIVMTEWGPYDHEAPFLRLHARRADGNEYALYGLRQFEATLDGEGIEVEVERRAYPVRVLVRPTRTGELLPYQLHIRAEGVTLAHSDAIAAAAWDVRSFAWHTDPREDIDAWHAEAEANGVVWEASSLDLPFGSKGPSETLLAPDHLRAAALPRDRFGTVATSRVQLPSGRWTLRTVSDDGLRVWVGEELRIDDWTHHGPTEHRIELELDAPAEIKLRVEHFELDGYATLQVAIEATRG